MDDKLKNLIEQNGGYITRGQIIGNRYLYYRLLESVKSCYSCLMCTNIRHLFLSAVILYIFSFEYIG